MPNVARPAIATTAGLAEFAGLEHRDADDQRAIEHAGQRQRRHQRRHAEQRDAETIQRAGQQPGGHGGDTRQPASQAGQQRRAKNAAERGDRADRQIEPLPARRHHHRLTQREQAEKSRDLELVGDLRQAEKARQQDLPTHQQCHADPDQQQNPPRSAHAVARRAWPNTMKASAAMMTRPLKNSCQMLGMPAK